MLSISDVAFVEDRQTISGLSGILGPGLGSTNSMSDFPYGCEVTVIAGDGRIVLILDSNGDFDGDSLVGKRKLVGLG